MTARTKKTTAPPKLVTSIYGYHPADDTPDLTIPTEVAYHYHVADTMHRLSISPTLEGDIALNGMLKPIAIATNGSHAMTIDGNHRTRIAVKLGLKEIPVQVVPDNLKRKASRQGFPVVEPLLAAWLAENSWLHEDHYVTRHISGGTSKGGIVSNQYTKCVCDCGARWREYR